MKGESFTQPSRLSRPGSRRAFGLAVIGILLFNVWLFVIPHSVRFSLSFLNPWRKHTPCQQKEFSWMKSSAHKDLNFEKCYGDLQCARLELPLDYWNGTNPSKTISLAVVKVPAKVPPTDSRYGGPILMNPGGPGGSGAEFVAAAGKMIQILVDSPLPPEISDPSSNAKYFDIIGFDPRGVGWTFPGAHCYNLSSDRITWGLREYSEGMLDSSDAALGRLWSMKQAFGYSCERGMDPGYDIKQFITTVSVARDMLELIEALGRHRQQETEKLSRCGHSKARYIAGDEKLQYWGFSYGTQLGSTYASMFPDRVGRMVLDGVLNGDNWSAGLWTENSHDTEKVMQYFYKTCAAAEPGLCALASPGSTADDIEAKVQAILKDLYHNPVPASDEEFPEVMTWSDIRLVTFGILYMPLLGFPELATVLSMLEQRNITAVADTLHNMKSCGCQRVCLPPDPDHVNDRESTPSIVCGDAETQDYLNVTSFRDHLKELERISPTGGAISAVVRLGCAGWKIRPLHRYRQAYGGETSHPILWIGNTADPVTPLISARKMSSLFPSSRVLVQDSAGHTSLSAFSICTIMSIKNYFILGELPPADTVCTIGAFQTPFHSNVTVGLPPDEDIVSAEMEMHANAHGEVARLSFKKEKLFNMRRLPFGIWES